MLAASDVPADGYQRIIWASLIVIGLIVVAFVLVAQVRRRLNQVDDSSTSGGTGFTLADLRQLHKSGQMTDREFELAKAKIVEAAKRASAREAAAINASGERDVRRQAPGAAALEPKPMRPDGDDEPSPSA